MSLAQRCVPLAFLAGCMFEPFDGQIVSNTSTVLSPWGAYPALSADVAFEARWPADRRFYAVATDRTDGAPFRLFDTDWFLWGTSAAIPSWAWRAGVVGQRAEVRARSGSSILSSYPEDGLSCIVAEDAAGTDMTTAQEVCGAVPSAFLFTPGYRGLPTLAPRVPVDYPRELEHDEVSEMQGVATTATDWFFAHNDSPRLVRIPLTEDLDDGDTWSNAAGADIPASLAGLGYDHYGDPDEHQGQVYVPIEGAASGAIAQFDLNLGFRSHATLAGPKAPWVAIDPTSGLLYTSTFCDVAGVDVYTMRFGPAGELVGLTFTDRKPLRDADGNPITLQRIQGGAFSDRGNLYLVSDAGHDECSGGTPGLYGFEADTFRNETFAELPFSPGWPDYEELEGLDVRDLSSGIAPGIGGQVHVVLLDNDSDDDLYFKHYEAALGELGFL